MPALEQYKKIQEKLAAKKAAGESLNTNTANIQKATEMYGEDKVNSALNKVQNAGVGIQNETTGSKIPAPLPTPVNGENNGTPEVTTPAPAPTTPVTPTTTPTDTTKTVENSTTPIMPTPPTGYEYGSVMDTKTGQPQLVKSSDVIRNKNLKKNKSVYSTGKSIYDGIQAGTLLPGSDEFADLQEANPQAFADYQVIKQENDKKNAITTLGNTIMGTEQPEKKSNTLESLLNTIAGGMDDDITTMYKNNVTNNPEYLEQTKKVNELNTKLVGINDNLRQLGDDVRKKYSAGTPESLISSAIAREAKPLIEQAQFLQDQVNVAQAEATRIINDNKEVFALQMQERTDNRNLAFKLYDTINAEEIRQETIQREDERITKQIALEEYRYERAKADGDASKIQDRQWALDDLKTQQEYNLQTGLIQIGIDPTGMTPEELKANYAQAAREAMAAQNQPKASDYLKTTVTNEDGSTSEVFMNPITGETLNPSQIFGQQAAQNVDLNAVLSGYSQAGQELLSVPDGTVIPTRLGEVSKQNANIRGKECAEYVNDIAGTKMGSTYASKLAVCNESTGGVGSVVAWKPNGSGTFGHTGIIVNEDADNYYIKSSNYVPGTVTTEKIPKTSIKNFYTPDSVKQIQQQESAEPEAKQYANGNIRTANGTLYTKAEAESTNRSILANDSYKSLKASEDFSTAWNNYKQLIDAYGIEMAPGETREEIKGSYQTVLRAAQKFFSLGVFQPYDEVAIQKLIPNTGRDVIGSKYFNPFERSKITGQVKAVDDLIKYKLQNEYESLSTVYGDYGDTLPSMRDVYRIYGNNTDSAENDIDNYLNQ